MIKVLKRLLLFVSISIVLLPTTVAADGIDDPEINNDNIDVLWNQSTVENKLAYVTVDTSNIPKDKYRFEVEFYGEDNFEVLRKEVAITSSAPSPRRRYTIINDSSKNVDGKTATRATLYVYRTSDNTKVSGNSRESGFPAGTVHIVPETITARKIWDGGPDEKPNIWFKIYRNFKDDTVEEAEEVPFTEVKLLENGQTSTTWENLQALGVKNNRIVRYEFSVKEVNESGEAFTPANYVKKENGLEIINTYTTDTTTVPPNTTDTTVVPSNSTDTTTVPPNTTSTTTVPSNSTDTTTVPPNTTDTTAVPSNSANNLKAKYLPRTGENNYSVRLPIIGGIMSLLAILFLVRCKRKQEANQSRK